MDQVIAIFTRSITKMLGRLAGGVVMMAACALVAFRAAPAVAPGGGAELVGAAGFVFFGLVTIAIFLQSFRTGPVVEVRTSGLRDHRRSPDVISWTTIAKVSIRKVRGRRLLALQFHAGTKLKPSRLGSAVGKMNAAASGFSISMAGLDGSFDDLINAIKRANTVAAREGL
jgi:hypothetical protein